MADLAREIGSRIRTQAVPGRDVAWVDTLDPLTVTLHGTTQAATNLSGQRLAVGDRVLVQRAGGAVIITHLHEARPQSGVVVGVTPGGEAVVEAGGREIEHVPVVDDASESVAELGRKPASAEGLSVSTWPYTDTDGANRGAVSVSWDPVTQGADGEPVAVDHYKIAIQHGPDAPWGVVLQTPLTDGEILNLDPGTDLGVTVHAVSEAGVTGPAPAHVRVVVARDTTPPPVPATPTGVSAMGTVTWTLTGMGVGGVQMPADYQHTILTCTGVRDGATVLSTHTVSGRGTVVAGPYDRGTTATASAVSVDRSGNESDDSPAATVAVKSVMDDSPLTGWRDELEEALETLDTDVLEVRNDLIPPLQQAMTAANTKLGEHTQSLQDAHNDLAELREAAVTGTTVEYAVSASETTPPTSGWSTAMPTRTPGSFIWMRTLVEYGNGGSGETAPVLVTGNAGPVGPPGEDGTSVQISGRVANQAALPTNLGPSDAGKGWITENDGHLHVWSGTGWTDVGLIRGPQGEDGADGADGVSVTSVTTYYRRSTTTPATPAGSTPSGWSVTEPGYLYGLALFRTERIGFSNGQVAYTVPTRVSADAVAGQALEVRRGFATYEWDGTEHLSESVERISGVAARRNLVLNPSFEPGVNFWARSGAGVGAFEVTDWQPSMWTSAHGGPGGRAGTNILHWDATGTNAAWIVQGTAAHIPVTPGEWMGASALVAADTASIVGVELQFRSGTTTVSSVSDVRPAPFFAGRVSTVVGQVPAGADRARILLHLRNPSGGWPAAGQRAWADAVLAIKASTEAEAWAQLSLGYFDGDSADGAGAQQLADLDTDLGEVRLSANRRNQIIHNLLPPYGEVHPETGEPLTSGDVWWQVDTLDPGRVTLGQWGWDGNGWRSATIGHEVINSVDVNDLNVYGTGQIRNAVMEKLWADGIGTNVLAVTDRIAVGGGNLLADWVRDTGTADPHVSAQPTPLTVSSTAPDANGFDPGWHIHGIRRDGDVGTFQNLFLLGGVTGDARVPVTPGQSYGVSALFRLSGSYPDGVPNVRYAIRQRNAAGAQLSFSVPSGSSSSGSWLWQEIVAEFVAHDEAATAEIVVQSSHPGGIRLAAPVLKSQIDAVLIGDGAVTAPKILADEAFAMKLGAVMAEFDHALIGKLEADYVRAGSWIGQLLSGVNIKISDDPDDPLAEHIMLANLAMRIMRGDGDGGLYEATSLGGAGLDQLSMRPSSSGSPRVVISGDGNASFAGHASVGTLAVGGELLSERLARLPQGIMADFPVSGAAIRSWGNTNYGLVRLSWQMEAGRRYKLSMKLNLQGQLDDSYWLTVRTTRGSTLPTVGTAIFAQDYGTIAPNAAVGSTNHDTHEHEFTIMDTYNGTFNALVVIRTWNANREMRLRSGADYVSRFTLEDMGFVDGAAVVLDPAGGNPFTGTAPAPAPQPTPRKQTLYRSNWRSFRDGSTYSGASELEHGTFNGIVRRSQLLFPAIPSGATNIRAKLRIRATHTWAGSGATFYIGIGTESSLQTSVPGHSAGAEHHFARGEEKEIPLPGWTTSQRSVWLGIGAPGTTAAYGRLDPSSAYIVYDYDLA